MPANKVRVGVIGVGRMGERHSRVYAGMSDVEFVGVSDLSAQRGRAVATRYDVGWYEDFNDLLRDVDAVSIATPTATHFEVAAGCLAQQVHVLLEKPIAPTEADCRRIVDAAKRNNNDLLVSKVSWSG